MTAIRETDSRTGRLSSLELRNIPDGETGAVNRADSVIDDDVWGWKKCLGYTPAHMSVVSLRQSADADH